MRKDRASVNPLWELQWDIHCSTAGADYRASNFIFFAFYCLSTIFLPIAVLDRGGSSNRVGLAIGRVVALSALL